MFQVSDGETVCSGVTATVTVLSYPKVNGSPKQLPLKTKGFGECEFYRTQTLGKQENAVCV